VRLDDLTQELVDARDGELPADSIAGRKGVHRRLRRLRAQRITAVTAVLAVLVGAGVLAANRAGEEESLITDTGELPLLVPTWLPDGFELYNLSALAPPPGEDPGFEPAFRRFQRVIWTDGRTDEPDSDATVVMVTAILDADSPADVELTALDWSNAEIFVSSNGSEDEHLSIESTVSFGSDGGLRAELPDGFEEVSRDSGRAHFAEILDSSPLNLTGQGRGYALIYSDISLPSSSDGIHLIVTDLPRRALWRTLASPDAPEEVSVGGRRAWADFDRSFLFWWETEDRVVLVVARSSTPGLAERFAEGLRAVSEQEWQVYVESRLGAQPTVPGD
jgi:hypothetical protein